MAANRLTLGCAAIPNGDGKAFTEAQDEDGNEVDATLTLYIPDSAGEPVYMYPFEDCWQQLFYMTLLFPNPTVQHLPQSGNLLLLFWYK